ncbi:MAG: hypothetical protein J0M11_09745 [Anaerolineae bacterium]|nr:hypothetical protein [Anaerolineae bacterium]
MYIPKLPSNYIERAEKLRDAISALTNRAANNSGGSKTNTTALTVALKGAGGFGKSTLAIAVCANKTVIDAFPDGIFWVELGENIKNKTQIVEKLNHLLFEANADNSAYTDLSFAASKLREVLLNKKVLIVIDDVWNSAHLEPFLQVGTQCAHLITTRDTSTLPLGTKTIDIDSVSSDEGLLILKKNLPGGSDDLLRDLSNKLWNWPLLLSLANGKLNIDVHQNHALLDTAIEKAILLYELRGITAFDLKKPFERNQAASLALDVSIEQLDLTEKECLFSLAVFPENTLIPVTALRSLWNRIFKLTQSEVELYCSQFANASLIQHYDSENGTFRIHAVIHEYLLKRLGKNKQKTHRDLVEGYLEIFGVEKGKWWQIPDDLYYYQNLIYHLLEADYVEHAYSLLFNYFWIKASLNAGGVTAIIRDCEFLLANGKSKVGVQAEHEINILRDFLRLSALTLAKDTRQLPSQILGRLLDFNNEQIKNLVEQARNEDAFVWLSPYHSYLTMPGGSEIMTIDGHSRSISKILLINDERRLISVSDDGVIKVWDIQNGECLQTFKNGSSVASLIAINDGNIISVISKNGNVKYWDILSGVEIPTKLLLGSVYTKGNAILGIFDGKINIWQKETLNQSDLITSHEKKFNSLMPYDKRSFLIVSGDFIKNILDLENEENLHFWDDQDGDITAEEISSDSKRLAAAFNSNCILIYDIEKKEVVSRIETTLAKEFNIVTIALSPSGKLVAASSDNKFDYSVKVWDVDSGNLVCTLKGHENRVQAITFAYEEKWIVSVSNDRTVRIWDIDSRLCIATLHGHSDKVNTVIVAKDSKIAFSGSRDKTIKMWNLETIKSDEANNREYSSAAEYEKHSNPINDLAIENNKNLVLSASQDSTIKIWEIKTGNCLNTLLGHSKAVNSLALSFDGNRLLSGDGNGTIIYWDLKNQKNYRWIEKRKFTLQKGITALSISADGLYAVSGNKDSIIDIWSLENGLKHLRSLNGHIKGPLNMRRDAPKAYGITSLIISKDGNFLFSAASDTTIKIWDIKTGAKLRTLKGHNRFVSDLALSSDNRKLISASYDTSIKIWDIDTGKCVDTLRGHQGPVRSLTITGDGKKIISASSDNTLRVWNTDTGECSGVFYGHTDRVNAVAVDFSGIFVLSASNDKTVRVWNINSLKNVLTYTGDLPFYTIAFAAQENTSIITGDHKGNVHFLTLIGKLMS